MKPAAVAARSRFRSGTVAEGSSGTGSSLRHGAELAGLREAENAVAGGRIDWRATARTGRPVMKRFEPPAPDEVVVLVERSPSMDWGSGTVTKSAYAADAVDVLRSMVDRDRLPCRVLTDFAAVPQSGTVRLVALTDLAGERQRRWLVGASRRLVATVLLVLDPWEIELPAAGLVRFGGLATSAALVADCGDVRLREAYRQTQRRRRLELGRLLHPSCPVHELRTDRPLAEQWPATV